MSCDDKTGQQVSVESFVPVVPGSWPLIGGNLRRLSCCWSGTVDPVGFRTVRTRTLTGPKRQQTFISAECDEALETSAVIIICSSEVLSLRSGRTDHDDDATLRRV